MMDADLLLEFVPEWQFTALAAIFGALWGSFANVVIVRWPREESVVRPASHCMACNTPIAFYDNIPVVSYLLLRGRCRHCRTRFSPRYALVELSMALLSVGVLRMTLLATPLGFWMGLTSYFVWFAFIFALVIVGMIDLDTFLLPDIITLPGIGVGIAVNTFVYHTGWVDPLVAAAGSYGALSLLFVHGYKRLTGRQGMGEGDPKLLAMIGAFLLLKGAMFTLFAAALQGLVAGSVLVLYRRKQGAVPRVSHRDDEEDDNAEETGAGASDHRFRRAKVPFGPFLALGAIEYYFFGQELVRLYTGFIGRWVGLGL
jgi:leader peptidase (prepilin peptidase) / N-methyltransferase